MNEFEILLGADIMPTAVNAAQFCDEDLNTLLGEELQDVLCGANFRIFNLEGPLIEEPSPIEKDGPLLGQPVGVANGLAAMRLDLLLLANNHILDHGSKGAKSTIAALEAQGIAYIGVGASEEQRQRAYYIRTGDVTIGVYNCCEHEFSAVEEGRLGANPYDPLASFDAVTRIREQCDYLIVAYHGGKEKYRYPSPELQRIFRMFARKGADVVVAQHTHCVGSFEEYEGSLLVYGQGNFLFGRSMDEYCSNGLLIRLRFSGSGFTYDFIPVLKGRIGVRLADEEEKNRILSGFYERSKKITDREFVSASYQRYAVRMLDSYLLALHGRTLAGRICRRFRLEKQYLIWLKRHCYSRQTLLKIYNSIRCEAHAELMQVGLNGWLEDVEQKQP